MEHVEGCDDCRRRLVQRIRPASQPPPAPEDGPALQRGTRLGRYVLLELLGSGAMGMVYTAEDPELKRRVALKLLRPGAGREDRATSTARLLREAQALARLADPNVTRVYDVGMAGSQVFLALELIDGQTLAEWLASGARTTAELLAQLVGAGRGLAAAHRAGLVHRDFKPGNVLVGADGAARVTDFGLARGSGEPSHPAEAAPSETVHESLLDVALTREGARAGTPPYMAPELLRGEPATPLTDQYAFCVTAYECLFGVRPFPGDSVQALLASAAAGVPSPPVSGRRVSARQMRAIVRGLHPDPARRNPSMEALLAELAPKSWPSRWVAVAAVALSVGTVAAAVLVRPADGCAASNRWEGVWDGTQRQALTRAFLSTGAPGAELVAPGVVRRLDAYTARWSQLHLRACKATQVSAPTHGDRAELACLEQRREDVARLVRAFLQPERAAVERAVNLEGTLVALDRCATLRTTVGTELIPEGEAAQRKVQEVRAQLGQARALMQVGRGVEAVAMAEGALQSAREVGFESAAAEALLLSGHLHAETEGLMAPGVVQRFYDAALASERHRLDQLAAESWIASARSVAGKEPTLALERLDLANVALERAGSSLYLRASLMAARGLVLSSLGRLEEALVQLRGSVDLTRQANGALDVQVAEREFELATVLGRMDRCEEALPQLQHAEALLTALAGPEQPRLIQGLSSHGICLVNLRRSAEAIGIFQRAIALIEKSMGPQSPRLASPWINLAGAYLAQDRHQEALELLNRALELRSSSVGKDHPSLAPIHQSIAVASAGLGHHAEALAAWQQALALASRAARESPDVAEAQLGVGDALLRLGRTREALGHVRDATSLFERLHHPRAAVALATQGSAFFALGQLPQARHALETALQGDGRVVLVRARCSGEVLLQLAQVRARQGAAAPEVEALLQDARAQAGTLEGPVARAALLRRVDDFEASRRASGRAAR